MPPPSSQRPPQTSGLNEASSGVHGLAAGAIAARVLGGRYQVIEELGRGGMGVVYRVRDLRSGSELALKQLLVESDALRNVTSALFQREFHALAQLAHPRVIEVYDYTVDPEG